MQLLLEDAWHRAYACLLPAPAKRFSVTLFRMSRCPAAFEIRKVARGVGRGDDGSVTLSLASDVVGNQGGGWYLEGALSLHLSARDLFIMIAEISIIIANLHDAGYRRLHMAGNRVGRAAWLQVQLFRGTASGARYGVFNGRL